MQALLFPWVVRHMSYRTVFQAFVLLCALFTLVMPFTSALQPPDPTLSPGDLAVNATAAPPNAGRNCAGCEPGSAAFVTLSVVFTGMEQTRQRR